MESHSVNGDISHESNDREVHVTQAEVNHDSHESTETQEPIALKRNLLTEESAPTDSLENDDQHKSVSEPEEQTPEPEVSLASETVSNEPVETSESFMKMEEKNVIERLSRIVDSQLTLEVSKNDDNPEDKSVPPEEVGKEESTNFKDEKAIEEQERTEETETTPVVSTFSAVDESVTENNESVGEVDLKSDYSIRETQEQHNENEVRLQSFEDNSVTTHSSFAENHIEHKPEVVREEVKEVEVIKQNGNKLDENQNHDEEEEEDQLKEIIGFKNTLKMWSSGKTTTSSSAEPSLDEPVNSKDKFKTLRQIRKGNTRSLMEKFQFNK